MQLEKAKILRPGRIRRAAEKGCERPDVPDIVVVRLLNEVAHRHVFDHAPAQRADGLITHRGAPVLRWRLIDPSILKTERPPVTCARSKSYCGRRNRPTAPPAPPAEAGSFNGTFPTWRSCLMMSVDRGEAEIICSFRVFRILTLNGRSSWPYSALQELEIGTDPCVRGLKIAGFQRRLFNIIVLGSVENQDSTGGLVVIQALDGTIRTDR